MARTSSTYTVCTQVRCIASFVLMAPFLGLACASALGSELQHPELLLPASCVLCLYGFRGVVPGDGKTLFEFVVEFTRLFRPGPKDGSA